MGHADVADELEDATGISVAQVNRSFGDIVALEAIDLHVSRHQRVGIVGPSGCGKSSLLALVCGLDEPTSGSINVLGGHSAAERLASCAWMPQRDLLLPWRTVLANASLPLENKGLSKKDAYAIVEPLFERFGLGGFEQRFPYELSGGMRQRVSFLRTLVAGKDVLLLDEPFGALDSITRADVQQWLRSALDDEPRTVLLVTHDVEEAVLLSDVVVVISPRPGRIVARIPISLAPVNTRRDAVMQPDFIAARGEVLDALEA